MENVRAAYEAIVDYHNGLVQTRFTVAGLYLAATGFLVSAWFNGVGPLSGRAVAAYYVIPILGATLTAACWILEIRTYQLLENLAERGRTIEQRLGILPELTLFELMRRQPKQARLPFLKLEAPRFLWVQYFLSHSFGLNALYATILLFWLLVAQL
jgi:hypothetical protein